MSEVKSGLALDWSRMSLRSSGLRQGTVKPGDDEDGQIKKAGLKARHDKTVFRECWVPGRSGAPPGLEGYFLDFFFDFDFFAFFAFFAFLAIVSSQGFNGWKRDTRHARRRASLATSSKVIPTDSRRAAPCCHLTVIALSTDVMRFDAFLPARCAPSRKFLPRGERSRRPEGLTMRQRGGAFWIDLQRLHPFKTTARIGPRR
jgi:hypothetical protein